MKAITTRYHGPTDTKGARISATDGDGNRVSIPYPHHLDTIAAHQLAAKKLIHKQWWWGQYVTGWAAGGYVHVPVMDVWEVAK